jgi:hypothetical protein
MAALGFTFGLPQSHNLNWPANVATQRMHSFSSMSCISGSVSYIVS